MSDKELPSFRLSWFDKLTMRKAIPRIILSLSKAEDVSVGV